MISLESTSAPVSDFGSPTKEKSLSESDTKKNLFEQGPPDNTNTVRKSEFVFEIFKGF